MYIFIRRVSNATYNMQDIINSTGYSTAYALIGAKGNCHELSHIVVINGYRRFPIVLSLTKKNKNRVCNVPFFGHVF